MKVGDGYRQLMRSDIISEGDEWYDSFGIWHPVSGSTIGQGYWTYAGRCIRRKTENKVETSPAPEHTKESNPKDAIGSTKPPIANVPLSVLSEVGMALAEGQYKYGGYNWRVIGVRASVYWDATFRHIKAWWEGEDVDPDSKLSHITKAISALMVLRDAMIQDNWTDDRPPRSKQKPEEVAAMYKEMLERLKSLQPDPVPGYTQKGIEDVK